MDEWTTSELNRLFLQRVRLREPLRAGHRILPMGSEGKVAGWTRQPDGVLRLIVSFDGHDTRLDREKWERAVELVD